MRERTAVYLSLRWGDVVLRTAYAETASRFVLLSVPDEPARVLGPGSRTRFDLGTLSVDVEVELAEPRPSRRFPLAADGIVHQAFSLAFHVGLVATLALFIPRLAPDEADVEERAERVTFLLHALDGSALPERERPIVTADDEEPSAGQGGDGRRSGGSGSRESGEEGASGSAVAPARGGHIAVVGPRHEPDPHLAHEATLRDAATFGLATGLLAVPAAADPRAPSSPWGRATSQATDRTSARAPLWGDTVEDAFGAGALALSGAGEGGGGRAHAMGLGDFGALGRGAGTGTSAAFGAGEGMGGGGEGSGGRGEGIGIGGIGTIGRGSHQLRAPRVIGDACSVSGRLGAEVIQRIVRLSFGRFRGCYEKGLHDNPALEGRVTTRFLIARDGSVAASGDGGSDIPDPKVLSCVVGAFAQLSFPEPAGGTVTVDYPIAFSPE